MADDQTIKNNSLAQQAYASISAAIVEGRLDFGEPLSEIELAKALGMSKSPVRNAIKELQVRGLVDIVPQSGTYVFSPTEAQIVELSEFRKLLEEQGLLLSMERNPDQLIAELGEIVEQMQDLWSRNLITEMKRSDTRYHLAFIRNAGNSYLTSAYADVSLLVEALRYRFMDTIYYRNRAYEEHLRLFDLLRNGHVQRAVKLLHAHVERTKEFQSRANWSGGRALRRTYRTRQYTSILNDQG